MKVERIDEPDIGESSTRNEVDRVVRRALQGISTQGDRFIVNDSEWFSRKRRGGVGRCVVNSASFLSSKFQSGVAAHTHWQGETAISRQRIDGFANLAFEGIAYSLAKSDLTPFVERYIEEVRIADSNIGTLFALFYGMYVRRRLFDIAKIPACLHHYFRQAKTDSHLRVGVEFETGNIASSFRAFQKLQSLFASEKIDAGVFVTCLDKETCAARIWPVSNRNGSFVELRNRNYKDSVALPVWEYGFAPDGFDKSAAYLGKNGNLFRPTPTGETHYTGGRNYKVWRGEDSEDLLQPE